MPQISRVAAAAYDLLPRRGQEAPEGRHASRTSGQPGCTCRGSGGQAGQSGHLPDRTGLGHRLQYGDGPRPGQWAPGQSGLPGRAIRPQGDLLAEIDPRPFQVQLAQAEGQMARDQAQLKNAQRDLERFKILLSRDMISKQEFDAQIATIDQYEGAIKSDQAQIDNAKLQLTYSRITAPISGRIGLRLVDEGNMVQANDSNGLAVITQLQPIAVLFNIPQDDLPKPAQTGCNPGSHSWSKPIIAI